MRNGLRGHLLHALRTIRLLLLALASVFLLKRNTVIFLHFLIVWFVLLLPIMQFDIRI